MKIVFSDLALETLQEIVDFLEAAWTDKELNTMRKDIQFFRNQVQRNFKIYPVSKYDENVREAIIGNKQVKLLFEKEKDKIIVVLFWNNKGDTKKLINLIKNRT